MMIPKKLLVSIKLIFILFLCLSCKNHEDKNTESLISSLEMSPSDSIFPKLTASYINSKKGKIERFFNKNWPSKNNNITVSIANQYGESLAFYTVPIGGVPKYKYKIKVTK